MIVLYDNPFSPFTRKVRMVLHYKELPFESIDALALHEHERLARVNPRAEVPTLVDGESTVIDSADIVSYLEDRYPTPPILPQTPGLRARARWWQRIADTVLDSIIHDISIWIWPTHRRRDQPPAGLVEAGRRDLQIVLGRLEDCLGTGGFVCGELSIADLALFPHVSSLKALGLVLDEETFPRIFRWSRRLRAEGPVRRDLEHVRASAIEKFAGGTSPYESEKIVWRGDRIEWLVRNGFQDWWLSELASGRAVIPSALAGMPRASADGA